MRNKFNVVFVLAIIYQEANNHNMMSDNQVMQDLLIDVPNQIGSESCRVSHTCMSVSLQCFSIDML